MLVNSTGVFWSWRFRSTSKLLDRKAFSPVSELLDDKNRFLFRGEDAQDRQGSCSPRPPVPHHISFEPALRLRPMFLRGFAPRG